MRVMERGDSNMPLVLNLEGGKNYFAPLSAIIKGEPLYFKMIKNYVIA